MKICENKLEQNLQHHPAVNEQEERLFIHNLELWKTDVQINHIF